jgi:hypothetical protein
LQVGGEIIGLHGQYNRISFSPAFFIQTPATTVTVLAVVLPGNGERPALRLAVSG